ncbi:MAG: co-chaperone GroES [Patescibacteria group bacterium]
MLKPIGSRLLIEPLVVEDKTATGILLPETAKEKPQRGKVLAVGSGRTLDNGGRESIDVTVGSVVYFSKYGPTEVKINGQEMYLIDFNDVLAVEQ